MAKKCKPFEVENIDAELKEKILQGLIGAGADVDGDNPWEVDLNRGGVKVKAEWDEVKEIIKISVLKRKRIVSCKRIKREIIKGIEEARNQSFISNPSPFNLISFEEEE